MKFNHHINMNLRQYYKFPKVYVQRFLLFASGSVLLYLFDRKFSILNRLKTQILDDMVHTDSDYFDNEVDNDMMTFSLKKNFFKSFTSNSTKQNFSNFLNEFNTEETIEDSSKNFVKNVFEQILIDEDLMKQTTRRLIDIVSESEEGDKELMNYLNYNANVKPFFKEIFTSEEILNKFSEVFINAKAKFNLKMNNDKENNLNEISAEILDFILNEIEVRKFLRNKAINLYSMYITEQKYVNFDQTLKKTNEELIKIINNI